MRARLVFVCFVVCRRSECLFFSCLFCVLWWWWCRGVAGTATAWSRDKTFLNCSSVRACVLACVLLPCQP